MLNYRQMKVVLIVCLFFTSFSFGQINYGAIKGSIIDGEDVPAPFVKILVFESNDPEGKLVAGCQSDFDGKFQLNTLKPGEYNLTFTGIEFDTLKLEGVIVNVDQITFLEPVVINYVEFDCHYGVPMEPIRTFEDPFGRSTTIEPEDIRRD